MEQSLVAEVCTLRREKPIVLLTEALRQKYNLESETVNGKVKELSKERKVSETRVVRWLA